LSYRPFYLDKTRLSFTLNMVLRVLLRISIELNIILILSPKCMNNVDYKRVI